MQRARVAARLALEPFQAAFRRRGWDEAVGQLRHRARDRREHPRARSGRGRHHAPTASNASFDELGEHRAHPRSASSTSITDDRKLSFAGGVAILAEVFEQLGIESMRVADGAMREGLLYDMLGRFTDEDARERTVRSMQERYHVDLAQAERVENTAANFLAQVEEAWKLDDPAIGADPALGGAPARDRARRRAQRLSPPWRLSARERRHGRVSRARSSSCSRIMVGSHRRKLALEEADELAPPWDKRAPAMIVLLRLAVLLHRGRSTVRVAGDRADRARRTRSKLRFPPGWLEDHPLTVADLQQEIEYLKAVGFRLRVFTAQVSGAQGAIDRRAARRVAREQLRPARRAPARRRVRSACSRPSRPSVHACVLSAR